MKAGMSASARVAACPGGEPQTACNGNSVPPSRRVQRLHFSWKTSIIYGAKRAFSRN